MAAMSLDKTQTALGTFYRRLALRIGNPQVIAATARKLSILVYRALKRELVYRDPGADVQRQTVYLYRAQAVSARRHPRV